MNSSDCHGPFLVLCSSRQVVVQYGDLTFNISFMIPCVKCAMNVAYCQCDTLGLFDCSAHCSDANEALIS